MSVLCCQKAFKIIQNLQQIFWTWVWPPPPLPFERCSKKLRIWCRVAPLSPKCKMLALLHNGKMWNDDFTRARNVPTPPSVQLTPTLKHLIRVMRRPLTTDHWYWVWKSKVKSLLWKMTLKCSSENLWEPKAAPLDGALFSPAANFFYNFYNFFYNLGNGDDQSCPRFWTSWDTPLIQVKQFTLRNRMYKTLERTDTHTICSHRHRWQRQRHRWQCTYCRSICWRPQHPLGSCEKADARVIISQEDFCPEDDEETQTQISQAQIHSYIQSLSVLCCLH